MKSLTPFQAANFADMAYEVKNGGAAAVIQLKGHTGYAPLQKDFDIKFNSDADALKAKTGFILKLSSNFGFLAFGKNQYKNNLVVAIRGTNSVLDVLTDLNIGTTTAENGSRVHAGFQRCFDTLMPALKRTLTPLLTGNAALQVHCVGHSLGGALAHMTGDWIKRTYHNPVKLYSFGAPRVGMQEYARKTTDALSNIYRCIHAGDPVPMIPLWPFAHTYRPEYRLSAGTSLGRSRHTMGADGNPGYLNTAAVHSWDGVSRASAYGLDTYTVLDEKQAGQVTFNEYWAQKITAALITLLKKSGYEMAVFAQARISNVLTVYDFIAKTLDQLAGAASHFVAEARGVISHVMRFVGMVTALPAVLTYTFIKAVFRRMVKKLYGDANKAIKDSLK